MVVPNNVNMELQIGTLVLRLDDATETCAETSLLCQCLICDVGGTLAAFQNVHPVKDTILNTTLKSVGLVAEVCQEAIFGTV